MMKRRVLPSFIAGIVALAGVATARVDLVTLPGKDATELTIYRSVDLTLVHDTRTLTFKKGLNEIQFSWANTLIDPTSLRLEMVKMSPDFVLLDASYPANSQNTIVWTVDARQEGDAQVRIRYFASGMTWQAYYTAVANPDETLLRIEPSFRLTNNTGEDFVEAKTRLVVGEVNLVEMIADLAMQSMVNLGMKLGRMSGFAEDEKKNKRERSDMPMGGAAGEGGDFRGQLMKDAKDILKEAVSEYQLYSISGTESLETGWSKSLPDPTLEEIPVKVSYEYNPRKYGASIIKFYKFKNDGESKLGKAPMPQGLYYVYNDDVKDGMQYQGSFDHKYVPLGEDVEIQLVDDGRVKFEDKLIGVKRTTFEFDSGGDVAGYDVVLTRTLEIRNSLDRVVPMKVTLPMENSSFSADWELTDASDTFKKVDRNTAEWELEIPALAKKEVTFVETRRVGSRDRTNK